MLLDMVSLLNAPERIKKGTFREKVDLPVEVGQLKTPVVGGFTAQVTNGRPFCEVKGEFQAELELACHRCGNPFATSLDFVLDEILELVDEAPKAVEVGDSVWSKGQLDVSDLVRQNLILALPSQVLCGCRPLAPLQESDGEDI